MRLFYLIAKFILSVTVLLRMSSKAKTNKKVQTTWFVEPLNDRTNKIIADNLSHLQYTSDQESVYVDDEGESRPADIWEVPNYAFVSKLKAMRIVKMNIFRKQSRHGKISRVDFQKFSKKKKTQKKPRN